MMRFNASCMEVPTTGEPTAQASFECAPRTSGVFIARIKRAGKRSKQLGWIELFLLDNDKLAMCSDSSTDSDSESSERFLLFPPFEGSAFRQVKRHGHALTLMAPAFSIVLEAEAGDDRAATQASKWARILQRLSTPEQSRSSTYFKGLGISLNTLTSKPQRTKQGRKQLVPMQPYSEETAPSEPQQPGSAGDPAPVSLIHSSAPSAGPRQVAPRSESVYSSSGLYTGFQPTGIPRSTSDKSASSAKSSKSSKRLSLGLAKPGAMSLDLGFGEDLKGILGALEPGALEVGTLGSTSLGLSAIGEDVKSASPEEPRIKEVFAAPAATLQPEPESKATEVPQPHNDDAAAAAGAAHPPSPATAAPTHEAHGGKATKDDLAAPSKPFSDVNSTPSPNSLYLQNGSPSNSSLLSSSSNKELNRMESILVKEQQQQLDRYGNRAAAMSSFDLSLPSRPQSVSASSSASPLGSHSSPSSTNPPPGIPPPVPASHPVRVAKRVSIAMTSPSVQYIPRDDESVADSDGDAGSEDAMAGGLPSPEPERRSSQPAAMRKKNPGIVKAVKKLWSKRRVPKEQHREFKGPMELLREQEELERQRYEIPRTETPPLDEDEEEMAQKSRSEIPEPPRNTAVSEWRALAMVQEESENESTPRLPSTQDEAPQVVAQAVVPPTPSHATSAVPKLNSQSSISALSFRSMRSQASTSSALTSDESSKQLRQDQQKVEQPKLVQLKPEEPKPEGPPTVARLDPKQDASWQQLVEQHVKKAPAASAAKPEPKLALHAGPAVSASPSASTSAKPAPAAAAPMSLDPGRFTTPDRTTNPIIRKVFESGNNKSTPALSKAEGQHSASSSYSSFGSFKRSAPSYGSQASSLSSIAYSNSASSISAPNLVAPQKPSNALEVTLLTTNLWVSKWGGTKWTPLSQLELRTDVVATSAGVRLLVMNPGGVGCIPVRFSAQCELRRVSAHDTELKTVDNTYMFRGRDPENSQRFYRTLAALQTEGVGSTGVTLPTVSALEQNHDDTLDSRRRTLIPPVLSRTSYAPKYMGMSTSTIVEE